MSFLRNSEYVIYVPSLNLKAASLFLHTSNGPLLLAKPVTDIIRHMDPDQPLTAVRTLEQARATLGDPWEFLLALLGSSAIAAVAVSAIGMYGVTSRTVRPRTREIGIRMALGASSGSVVAKVVGRGTGSALVGVVLGSAVALAASRIIVSEFPWLETPQPWLIVQIALLLGVIALLACYAAARRAVKTDPIEVLRAE